MADSNDNLLLREYAERRSDAAFAELVLQHLNFVYSVALRHVGDAADAQDVAQAVFVILAQKADSLCTRSTLTGWLYETTRLTSRQLLRTRVRRFVREQEAYMQSTLDASEGDPLWHQLAPHLEDAMSRLHASDRELLALRFYENKTGEEAAALLGIGSASAHKRTQRALEKLQKIFARRGISSTTAMLAGAMSANSLLVAPAGLAKSISAVALAKNAVASTSTLTLVKGGLKIMAWTKMKTAVVVGASLLLVTGTATLTVGTVKHASMRQRLPDGSVLVLDHVSFGPTDPHFNPGREFLTAEFRVLGANSGSCPLVKPAFFRQFRCVVHGANGIEFIEEFSPAGFKKDPHESSNRLMAAIFPHGYINHVITSIFPRDSKSLWFQVEKSETNNPFGPWQTVAEFKVKNPVRAANHPWVASPTPVTNHLDEMDVVLDEVTVELRPFTPRDIWNHVVTMPVKIFEGGTLLTNWGPAFVHTEDASGNYDPVLQKHRSLDPKYIWKIEMDFEPLSGFAPESMATVNIPPRGQTITKEVVGQPVTISCDGDWIEANMPTNRPDLALKFVSSTDARREQLENPSGSWAQFRFRKGSFMAQRNGGMTMVDVQPATVTFAVVPNVHTTFYVQPKLMAGKTD